MTESINKLRRKHDWMASRIYNKSVENTEMMRHFQRYAEELQQQIFALQKRASTEEKEAPFRLKDMLMSLLYESEKQQKISTTVKTTEASTSTTTTTTTQTTLPSTTTLKPTATTLKPTTVTTTTVTISPSTSTTTTAKQQPTSTTSRPSTTTAKTTTSTSTTLTTPLITKMPTSSTKKTKTTHKPLMSTGGPTVTTSSYSNKRTMAKPTANSICNTTQEALPTEEPLTTVEQQQTTDRTKDISSTEQTEHEISTTMSTPSEVEQDTDSIDIDQPLANGVFLDLLPDRFDADSEQGETFIWGNDEN